jgi:hypothetical protein
MAEGGNNTNKHQGTRQGDVPFCLTIGVPYKSKR